MPIDYSSWKEIEVSDDEDDTHPNVDTASLFRWRHDARMQKMEERQKRKETFEEKRERNVKELSDVKSRLANSKFTEEEKRELRRILKNLEEEREEIRLDERAIEKEEKLAPWNIDTIAADGWSKTIINKKEEYVEEVLSDEERAARYEKFVEQHEADIKTYGLYAKLEDCRTFLNKNKFLVCEEAANYLVLYCLQLELQGKSSLMQHIARQAVILQFILQLARQIKIDPKSCINQFFTRITAGDKQYDDAFDDELSSFKKRIQDQALAKGAELQQEFEKEQQELRQGPGGLDPQQVINELPPSIQKAFVDQDPKALVHELDKLNEPWAIYFMNRCVKSGLWMPENAKDFEQYEADMPAPEIPILKEDSIRLIKQH